MNRVINITHEDTINHFEEITNYEVENNFKEEIESGLSSIFLISQKFPIKDVSDFFSGENFSIKEAFEEFESSYHLIKYGFFKQSMISLRVGFDIGLLSIYWSIIGNDKEEFKKWYSSKLNSPYKDKKFWKVLNSDQNISAFGKQFGLRKDIESLGSLSDYVHTKGVRHSNYGKFQRKFEGKDKFDNFELWIKKFKKVVQILEILHLLRYPKMCIEYSTEFLLKKFGTLGKIPQFGVGLGNEKKYIFSFISAKQKKFIEQRSKEDEEVQEIKKWLSELPDLSQKEIEKLIIDEQKNNIITYGGFNNWVKNVHIHDSRIDSHIISELKEWSKNEGLMTFQDSIDYQINS